MIFVFTQEVFGGRELRPVSDDDIVRAVSELFLHGVVGHAPRSA